MELEEEIDNNNIENENQINKEKGKENLNDTQINIEEKQNSFLESTLGKVINTGIDVALRAILPNAIEDEVIGIKNVIITDGFKEGINAAISAASNIGKSVIGIFTGKFESVSQAYSAVKSRTEL